MYISLIEFKANLTKFFSPNFFKTPQKEDKEQKEQEQIRQEIRDNPTIQ